MATGLRNQQPRETSSRGVFPSQMSCCALRTRHKVVYLRLRRVDARGRNPHAQKVQDVFYPQVSRVHSFSRSIRRGGLTGRSTPCARKPAQARRRPEQRPRRKQKSPWSRSLPAEERGGLGRMDRRKKQSRRTSDQHEDTGAHLAASAVQW